MVHEISRQIYHSKILPNIKGKHSKVVNALYILKEACSLEIADYLNVPLNSVSGRFTELSGTKEYDKPIIEQCDIKKNRYGNKSAVWRIIVRQEKPLKQGEIF